MTVVSPAAEGKRYAFNGWWTSSWLPSVEDDLEELFATEKQRSHMTSEQYQELVNIIDYPEEYGLDLQRLPRLKEIKDLTDDEYRSSDYSPLDITL